MNKAGRKIRKIEKSFTDFKAGKDFEMVATCMQFIEPILADELKALGAKKIKILKRAVSFHGSLSLLYKANLWLRTALKILLPICSFRAKNDDQLYQQVFDYPWPELFRSDRSFAIDAAVHSEHFTHSHYALLKVKDAIVDRFRKEGSRPNIERRDADIRIHLHIRSDQVDISLDSSGDPLFKRGYKREMHKAPINECLAAAMIIKSGWTADQMLLDPMCGSATIPIEAALISANIPPNLQRQRFGFETWSNYDGGLLAEVLEEGRKASKKVECRVIARDKDYRSLRAAEININAARMKKNIQLERADFFDKEAPAEKGMIIINPPYGERLGDEEKMIEFYNEIGSRLKHEYAGWTAWIISSDIAALKRIGLKADEKHPLVNGKLECSFRKFSLFEGKRVDQ